MPLVLSNFILLVLLLIGGGASAEQCGRQVGGALCPGGLCCSEFGWCGNTAPYCALPGCQSQCWGSPSPPPPAGPPPPPTPPSPSGGGISDIISRELFDEMLKYRNDPRCYAIGFYTYDAFVTAAAYFPGFGTTGDTATRQREIAAFLGQTSHETTGGWATADDGPFAWGYCFLREVSPGWNYCVQNVQYPCAPGQAYYGRGPIQISYNYNYGPAGGAIGEDLLNNPDMVATDAVVSFKTAIWFWMTEQLPKPSCHDVVIGSWTPSAADIAAGRLPGYGVTTNIINGGLECGIGPDSRVEDRIGFYKRYCDMFGIDYGDNLDCANQRPFGTVGFLMDTM